MTVLPYLAAKTCNIRQRRGPAALAQSGAGGRTGLTLAPKPESASRPIRGLADRQSGSQLQYGNARRGAPISAAPDRGDRRITGVHLFGNSGLVFELALRSVAVVR
jgi:hypothetical protein